MSTISQVILFTGLAATALFLAGFWRGVRNALASRHQPPDTAVPGDSGHLGSAIFAVIASAAVITLIGIVPEAIYAGPFLAILTAVAVGIAFFVER